MAKPKRYSGDELHARLIFTVGLVLAFVFAISVIGFVYALMFVTQPISSQAPNDYSVPHGFVRRARHV
jgi:hypothetical protein